MQKKSSAAKNSGSESPTEPAKATSAELHPEHPRRHKRRTPDEFKGIQVNYCKNPHCTNFGLPIGKRAAHGTNAYKIVASGKGMPQGYCNGCGEHFPLKSNQGISEELSRMMRALEPAVPPPSCPNPSCQNHGTEVAQGKSFYSSFGITCSGSQRYKCKACQKTFSVSSRPQTRQRLPHKNKTIFTLIVNKAPIRRMAEIAGMDVKTVYAKIDFIHRQCMAFAQNRESKLPGMDFKRLYISVDHQDYVINWVKREDKRNTVVTAVASAENPTQYIFAMHLNFDHSLNAKEIEDDAAQRCDQALPTPYRRYARLWTQADYENSVKISKAAKSKKSLTSAIESTYLAAEQRDDIESLDEITSSEKLPELGMQIHSEYTLYAHFMYLSHLFKGAQKVRFFMDQDSGIRAACLAAFKDRVIQRTVDTFYVSINKEMTVDEKRRAVADAKKEIAKLMKDEGIENKQDAILIMLKRRISEAKVLGKWKDRWVFHPLATMSEPEKAMCHLTDLGGYDENHLAWIYNKASLHGVDSYFNQVRRRISTLERGINTSSNAGRVWSGYAPYNPVLVQKMLDILRVVHNYILKSKVDKKTPAMRLGLAHSIVTYEDILYFNP
jgi:transposase-like protein